MQSSTNSLRARVARLMVVGALAAGGTTAGIAMFAGSSGATGTMTCPNFTDTDVGAVGAGMTGYLVVGTSVDGTVSTLSGTYTLNGVTTNFSAVGELQGQSSTFHYIFQLPQGAVIAGWQVTGATANTVITVSGCLNGTVVTTTTTTTTTLAPNGGTNVAGESVTRAGTTTVAGAATAVSATPNLTG